MSTQLAIPGVTASVDPDAEFFPTPLELAHACALAAVNFYRVLYGRRPRTVLEPSAGSGPFIQALGLACPEAKVDAIDIRAVGSECRRAGARGFRQGDFRDIGADGYDLVLGNPPFSQAAEHVAVALGKTGAFEGARMVVFLLRLGFLCGDVRAPFWEDCPLLSLSPLRQRPSFTGGHDNTDYGLFAWSSTAIPVNATLTSPIDWR